MNDELREALEDRLNYDRLVASGSVSSNKSSEYQQAKLSDELKLRAKLSNQDKIRDAETEEMAPLFFFLASSFNVELVYIILKGIT